MKFSECRKYSNAQIAAAAIMLAMNISRSPIALSLKLTILSGIFSRGFYSSKTTEEDVQTWGPLAHWNTYVEKMTHLKRGEHVARPYTALLIFLNTSQYGGVLNEEKSLKLDKSILKVI